MDFETLMANSGASLVFAYDPKFWEAKRVASWVGAEKDDKRIARLLGFGWEWTQFRDGDEAWQIVRETIDSGRPAKGQFMEGCHASNSQWSGRLATARYLKHVVDAQTFRKDASEHLAEAAKQYKAAHGAWMEFYKQLGHVAPKDAWSIKKNRLDGAEAVRKALAHEETAIAELEKALAAEGP